MGYGNGIKLKKPAYTKDTNLYRIENIPQVFIPVGEHYTVTAQKGDRVLVGQLLGVALGKQIPLHCSVSGTVKEIVKVSGKEYIRIENDGKYELCSDIAPCEKRLSQMSADEMIDRIRLCGIHDWKKLSASIGKTKRFVINCLDMDPYMSDKKCAIANSAKEIVSGAKIILKILGLRLCEFVIEKHSTDAINDLIDYIDDSSFFDIVETSGKYPFGEEERIISLLPENEELESDELCILDVHTVCAVYNAFSQGMPYVRRIVSIGGSATYEDGCYDIPLGTPIKYIAEQCAEDEEEEPVPYSTVIGGVMQGQLADGGALVEDGTHCISFIKSSELEVRTGACIGCTRCDKACPDKLLPSVFIEKHEADFDEAVSLSGMDWCNECGACSFVCPAKIPICEIAKGNKAPLLPDKRDKKRKITQAPFVSHNESVKTLNLDLILALTALLAWAVCCFGLRALCIAAISVGTAVLTELLFNFLTKASPLGIRNLNSVVCGLMCALTLSTDIPLYVGAITAFFAVIFIKGAFGGNGKNIIHSAFSARVLASLFWHDAFVFDSAQRYTMFDYLLGNTEGAMGEVSVIILAAAFLYLVIRRVLSAITPIVMLSTFAVITFLTAPEGNAINTVQIMLVNSAVIFVSVFCAAEYSTVPKSKLGRVAHGIICGALAALIGRYTSYEGAYIAVLISSFVTPLFNRLRQAEPFEDDDDSYHDDEATLSPVFSEDGDERTDQGENETVGRKSYNTETADEPMPTSIFETSELSEDGTAISDDAEKSGELSDSREFSIERADEILEHLSAEIGILTGKERSVEITNDNSSHDTETDKTEAMSSTALFNKLFNEADFEDTDLKDEEDILSAPKDKN